MSVALSISQRTKGQAELVSVLRQSAADAIAADAIAADATEFAVSNAEAGSKA